MAEEEGQIDKQKKAEDTVAAWEEMVSKEGDKKTPPNGEGQLAEEWQNLTSDNGENKGLKKDEIANILNGKSSKDTENSGIQALIDKAMQSYQRLPMLEIVFDRYTRILSTSFRNLTSENVDVDIRGVHSLRFGDYINSVPMPALLIMFRVVEWDNFGLISLSGELVYSMVDVLFGGRKVYRPIRFDGKPFTNIEQMVVRQICETMLNDIGTAFEPLSPSTFVFERIETNPRFASIARPGDAAIKIDMNISLDARGGTAEILLPYATLEPVRDLLLQVFLGEKFGKDPAWELHIANELYNTTIELEAVLAEKEAKLVDIMKLEIGHTIILDSNPGDDVTINCAGIKMFAGKLGSSGDKIAVSVEKPLHKKLIEMMG
ncbi:MAG: flagellar motor switch protein FliM [Sphingobacteriia bacterium]|nr:flagellar motor switch protein FliM [Sphingobacteriia bacterium]